MAKITEQKSNDEEMVEIYIPLDHSNEDDDVFYCSVNGKAMLINKGEKVKVPKKFAEAYALTEHEQDIQRAKRRAEKIKNRI